MNETIKNEEALEEVNPVDEYLKNYKEQKLAEFCVQKDKEIENRKEERQKLMEQITDMKVTVKQHDETWKNMDSLYAKELSVNDYLKLYHMINNDIAGNYSTITTVLPSHVGINGNW
jgi:lysyl-tRNA synthetase class I